jgi:hypothetical protein
VGVGAGAAGGATAGAAVGSIAGPLGIAAGAVVGGTAGGLAGKAAAEAVNPTLEDKYWRSNYASRPYVKAGDSYDLYGPAYHYGWESYGRHEGVSFDDAETDLRRGWEAREGVAGQSWERAKHAVRDAWHRVERALPGDADRNGR